MSELDAIKYAIGIMAAIAGVILLLGIRIGQLIEKIDDHSKDISGMGLHIVRIEVAVNRIADALDMKRVCLPDDS